MYLDELLGPMGEDEEVPKSVVNKFVSIFKSNKSVEEKAKEAEEILRISEYKDDDKPMKLEVALTAATASIASALHKKDEDVQLKEIEETVHGLQSWLQDYVKNGGNVADINAQSEEDNEYVPVFWEEDEDINVDGTQQEVVEEHEVLAKRGTAQLLEKGWLPTGMSQNDLDDGDFAWISDAYKKDKSLPKSKHRKLPYKIHGKVNERGWKAAWAAINGARGGTITAGGPSAEQVKNKLLGNRPKSVPLPEKLKKRDWGEYDAMQPEKKRRLKTKKTNLMEVNMEKADMPAGLDGGAPHAAAAGGEAGAGPEGAGDKDWVGKTVIGPDGNRYIVVDQAGDMLTVAAGRKRATFSKDEVELVDEGAEEGVEAVDGAPVEKEAGTEDKLRSAIEVLTELLSSTASADSVEESAPAAVIKEGSEEAAPAENVTNDAGTTLNDVIYFVNGLADQLDEVKDKYASVGDLGPKLDQVGEMVKSVDFSERLEAIEARLAELDERAGASAPAETVEAVSKRLAAIENQPGSSAQLPADTEKVEKSADRMFRGLF